MSKCGSGEDLTALATAAAFQIAAGKSADDVNLLSAIFNVIGNQLALIAVVRNETEVQNKPTTKVTS